MVGISAQFKKEWLKKKKKKREQKSVAFFRKTINSHNTFSIIENNVSFLKIAKFEFKIKIYRGLWEKHNYDPLTHLV